MVMCCKIKRDCGCQMRSGISKPLLVKNNNVKRQQEYVNIYFFSGPQLWKLDGNTLLNKEGLWMSDDAWNIKIYTKYAKIMNLIFIENISKAQFLGSTIDGKVILEDYQRNKHEQVWKKGEPNAEGYFTLSNFKVSKVMTATSSTSLELKGDITKVDTA